MEKRIVCGVMPRQSFRELSMDWTVPAHNAEVFKVQASLAFRARDVCIRELNLDGPSQYMPFHVTPDSISPSPQCLFAFYFHVDRRPSLRDGQQVVAKVRQCYIVSGCPIAVDSRSKNLEDQIVSDREEIYRAGLHIWNGDAMALLFLRFRNRSCKSGGSLFHGVESEYSSLTAMEGGDERFNRLCSIERPRYVYITTLRNASFRRRLERRSRIGGIRRP